MENAQEFSAIREGQQTGAAHVLLASQNQNSGISSRRALQGRSRTLLLQGRFRTLLALNARRPVKAVLSIPRPFTVRFFLEIFCGKAGISKCMSKHGYMAVAWDIMMGPNYDLTSSQNQCIILGWLTSGWVLGVHIGTPCNSFSRARDHGPGPPRSAPMSTLSAFPISNEPGISLPCRLAMC